MLGYSLALSSRSSSSSSRSSSKIQKVVSWPPLLCHEGIINATNGKGSSIIYGAIEPILQPYNRTATLPKRNYSILSTTRKPTSNPTSRESEYNTIENQGDMMAHEMPVPIKDRSLPNGDKVDFGHGNKNVNHKRKPSNNKKPMEQSLPNGAKPVFGGEKKFAKENSYDSDTSNGSGHSKDKKKNGGKKSNKEKDVFAGSTFHSSPEALNLPKPSFKGASPRPENRAVENKYPVTNYPSPYYTPQMGQGQMAPGQPGQGQMGPGQGQMGPGGPGQMGQMPGGMMPMMPMNPMMPMGRPYSGSMPGAPGPGAPGFYPYYPNQQVQQHPPQYQLPPQSQQAKLPPAHPVQPFPANSGSGQKISFNDLIGSSK